MSNSTGELYEVQPREQVGAQTGKLFEYQYHQAAAGALSLLDPTENALCVYCEWHDDYVTEGEANGLYTFYQVKTRGGGPWTVGEFFGLGKLNPKTGIRPLSNRKSCIFSNLWDHTQKFGTLCQAFVFLSDAELDTDLELFIDECKIAPNATFLSPAAAAFLSSVLPSLAKRDKNVTVQTFFEFFQKFRAEIGIGTVDSIEDAKLIIIDRIFKASEVDLHWSEGRRMGSDLVTIVRSRSHRVLDDLPSTADELRVMKALSIKDVLKLLSLSEEGFRLLTEGAGDAVRTLSRLHRFCQRRGIPEKLIPDFCELKTFWSAWWLKHADLVDKLDFMVFKTDCLQILRSHSDGKMSIAELGNHAKALATKYNSIFNPLEPLTPECVMGFIISLAVEAER
jgi:Cap4 dsDNA endonuclease